MSSKDPTDAMLEFDKSVYQKNYALSGKLLLSAIVVLFFVIILLVCLHVYSQWYLLQVRRTRRRYHTSRLRRRPTTQFVFYVDPSNPNAGARATVIPRGLDATVLKSLPLFIYTAETHPDLIECPVCLSEFEEYETGRVLPKCKHSFHLGCIDMWFHSHSTCPLCRSTVEAPVPGNPTVEANPSTVGLGTSSAGSCQIEEGLAGGVASTSSFVEQRKPSNETVTIEVPPRRINSNFENESGTESPGSQALRSPMGHILSLKRILSREKRAAVSPPASCAESDIERGRVETQLPGRTNE